MIVGGNAVYFTSQIFTVFILDSYICYAIWYFQVQRAGPWEPQPEAKVEMVERPCPACVVPVRVSCLGNHEVTIGIQHNLFPTLMY